MEGETSFWNFFEEIIVHNFMNASSDLIIRSAEALMHRCRKSLRTWDVLIKLIEVRLPECNPDEVIRILHIFTTFKKDHNLWQEISNQIETFNHLTKEEVYQIAYLYHKGDRRKTSVWTFLQDKYLLGRGFYL